jgi:hypothetical protein
MKAFVFAWLLMAGPAWALNPVPSGADKVMLAIMANGNDTICESANNGSQSWLSATTGTAMASTVNFNTSETFTHAGFISTANSDGIPCVDTWYLDAPTPTTANVTFTTPSGGDQVVAIAIPLSNTATGRPTGRGDISGALVGATEFESNDWGNDTAGLLFAFHRVDETHSAPTGWAIPAGGEQACDSAVRGSFAFKVYSTGESAAKNTSWTTGSRFAASSWEVAE